MSALPPPHTHTPLNPSHMWVVLKVKYKCLKRGTIFGSSEAKGLHGGGEQSHILNSDMFLLTKVYK